ncbi:MAG: hypothetical protein NVS3B7_12380 [Candidatus Elarobacter sp.]
MRRFVLTFAAAASLALGACSGGGSVLSSGTGGADHIIIVTGGSSNVPRVLAGGAIALSAVSVRGSQNGILGNNRFIWHASLVNDATYPVNALGGQKPCARVTSAPSPAGPFTAYTPDYSIAVAIDPVNEANIIFEPPLTIPVPAGTFLGPLSAASAYCAIITATQGGTTGSLIVAIVNPQIPQQ